MPRHYPTKQQDLGAQVLPDFPGDLLPTSSKDTWNRVWQGGLGIYVESSYDAVVDLCRAEHAARKTWEAWERDGFDPVATGSNGQDVINPTLKAWKEMQTVLTTMRDRFGLTPRSAAELGLSTLAIQKQQNAASTGSLEEFQA